MEDDEKQEDQLYDTALLSELSATGKLPPILRWWLEIYGVNRLGDAPAADAAGGWRFVLMVLAKCVLTGMNVASIYFCLMLRSVAVPVSVSRTETDQLRGPAFWRCGHKPTRIPDVLWAGAAPLAPSLPVFSMAQRGLPHASPFGIACPRKSRSPD